MANHGEDTGTSLHHHIYLAFECHIRLIWHSSVIIIVRHPSVIVHKNGVPICRHYRIGFQCRYNRMTYSYGISVSVSSYGIFLRDCTYMAFPCRYSRTAFQCRYTGLLYHWVGVLCVCFFFGSTEIVTPSHTVIRSRNYTNRSAPQHCLLARYTPSTVGKSFEYHFLLLLDTPPCQSTLAGVSRTFCPPSENALRRSICSES